MAALLKGRQKVMLFELFLGFKYQATNNNLKRLRKMREILKAWPERGSWRLEFPTCALQNLWVKILQVSI